MNNKKKNNYIIAFQNIYKYYTYVNMLTKWKP